MDKKRRKVVIEGCYHEMGHIIANMIFFPNDNNRIQGISFSRVGKGHPYRLSVNLNEFQWSLPSQLEACIMTNISGGIFQQMKTIYNRFRCILDKLSDSNLEIFFQKVIKSQVSGMEEDLKEIKRVHSIAALYGRVSDNLDLEKEKVKAIHILIPFLKDERIDNLVTFYVGMIEQQCNLVDNISIDFATIKTYF